MFRLTILAKSDATVVLDTPMVRQQVRPVPTCVGVLKPAPGGPNVTPRRYEIKLDTGEQGTRVWSSQFRNQRSFASHFGRDLRAIRSCHVRYKRHLVTRKSETWPSS